MANLAERSVDLPIEIMNPQNESARKLRLLGVACHAAVGTLFLLAAASKIAAPPTDDTLRGALPAWTTGIPTTSLMAVLVALELITGVLLFVRRLASIGFWVGQCLLALFLGVIAINATNAAFLASCNCFGATGGESAVGSLSHSPYYLAGRDLLLSLLLVIGRMCGSTASMQARLSQVIVRYAVGTLALFLGLAVAMNRDLERRNALGAHLLTQSQVLGLPIGDFSAVDRSGTRCGRQWLDGQETCLVAYAPWCGACNAMAGSWRDMAAWLRTEGVRPVFVGVGDAAKCAEFLERHGLSGEEALFASGESFLAATGVTGFPTLLRLDRRGGVLWRKHPETGEGVVAWLSVLSEVQPQLWEQLAGALIADATGCPVTRVERGTCDLIASVEFSDGRTGRAYARQMWARSCLGCNRWGAIVVVDGNSRLLGASFVDIIRFAGTPCKDLRIAETARGKRLVDLTIEDIATRAPLTPEQKESLVEVLRGIPTQ